MLFMKLLGFFYLQFCLKPLGQHCIGFTLCNVVPGVFRTTPVQCCLEPLRQHSTGFWPVQSCPKSIKTILNKIFSCALLSGVSGTTLHRVVICIMLCCIVFWPAQCCPKSIKTTLNRIFSCALLSGVSMTTLHRVFTSVVLSRWC